MLSAQDRVPHYPVRFTQYDNALPILNPAAACAYSNMEISMVNQRMMGNLSKVSSYFASAQFKLGSYIQQRDKPFSTLGVVFSTDQEGKYINRTRFYAVYSWHAILYRNTRISGGLQFGGMNYSVKGTPLSGNGSDIKPDASFGLQVYNPNAHVGFSVKQLFNSELQPLEEITTLVSYANTHAGIKFSNSNNVTFQSSACFQFPLQIKKSVGERKLFSMNAMINYQNKFESGIGIHNNSRMVIHVGKPDLAIASGKVDIQLSYAFLILHNSKINTPQFEIGLVYSKN